MKNSSKIWIVIVVVLSIIFKKVLYKEESNNFISELPEYKIPNFNYVIKDVWDKVISFIYIFSSNIFNIFSIISINTSVFFLYSSNKS